MLLKAISAFATISFATQSLAAPSTPSPLSGIHGKKGITGIRTSDNATMLSSTATVPIEYHGGPIMTGNITVYPIFYGSWTSTQKDIVNTFINGLSATTWWNIEKTYTDSSGNAVTGPVLNGTSYDDNYSQGTSFDDSGIQNIVINALSEGLPNDTNGIYAVLTSGDVSETAGFCTQYCGWHTYANINGNVIKYLFAGRADACPSSCITSTNLGSSPNGDVPVDGMISVLAHEIVEAGSDPELNAWMDASGQENADKCAWTFGTTQNAIAGSQYNIVAGGRQYLIQQNWSAADQQCEQSA
ncbi:phosphate-induced protein 1 [Umbelopsis sp. PMI_123]|nr:phosphate-induced protein 1 [Umbelopsis sp. PMI_123]